MWDTSTSLFCSLSRCISTIYSCLLERTRTSNLSPTQPRDAMQSGRFFKLVLQTGQISPPPSLSPFHMHIVSDCVRHLACCVGVSGCHRVVLTGLSQACVSPKKYTTVEWKSCNWIRAFTFRRYPWRWWWWWGEKRRSKRAEGRSQWLVENRRNSTGTPVFVRFDGETHGNHFFSGRVCYRKKPCRSGRRIGDRFIQQLRDTNVSMPRISGYRHMCCVCSFRWGCTIVVTITHNTQQKC